MTKETAALIEKIRGGFIPPELSVPGYNSKGALLLRAILREGKSRPVWTPEEGWL